MDNLIKSFEEACAVRGMNPEEILPGISAYSESHRKAIIAVAQLFVIADVLNEGHVFNWNDNNERKWYPFFDMEKDENNPSGFRFDRANYCCTDSHVGSRLCFKSRELAEYAGMQFVDLYRDFFTINNIV